MYYNIFSDAELCNGSTADSDSVCEGSNPSSAANLCVGKTEVFENYESRR